MLKKLSLNVLGLLAAGLPLLAMAMVVVEGGVNRQNIIAFVAMLLGGIVAFLLRGFGLYANQLAFFMTSCWLSITFTLLATGIMLYQASTLTGNSLWMWMGIIAGVKGVLCLLAVSYYWERRDKPA